MKRPIPDWLAISKLTPTEAYLHGYKDGTEYAIEFTKEKVDALIASWQKEREIREANKK